MADNKRGGTWLGLSESGRIASLLNVLQPAAEKTNQQNVEGRGFLVVDYLRGQLTAETYMNKIVQSNKDYSLFNLVILEPGKEDGSDCCSIPYKLLFLNYVDKEVIHLDHGFHGFGNSFLSKPFLKVDQGKMKFEAIIKEIGLDVQNEDTLVSSLFKMMQDTTRYYPDKTIQEQGKGYPEEYLKSISSINIKIPNINYGTR